MTQIKLTNLQKQLCQILQQGLPICQRPYAQIARSISISEDQAVTTTAELLKKGLIKQIRPFINHRTLGLESTLVTASIKPEILNQAADTINRLNGVSHNYLRNHNFNLWFTLQAPSQTEIVEILTRLQTQFETTFHSLPVKTPFKLNVRFPVAPGLAPDKIPDNNHTPITEIQILTDYEKNLINNIQTPLEPIPQPFDFLKEKGFNLEIALPALQTLTEKGVIKRIAAVLDYRKLGFRANVMFVCQTPPPLTRNAGKYLAALDSVSHCYERKTFENFPYNLYAMMHRQNFADIQHDIEQFTAETGIIDYLLLETVKELKKSPVIHELT